MLGWFKLGNTEFDWIKNCLESSPVKLSQLSHSQFLFWATFSTKKMLKENQFKCRNINIISYITKFKLAFKQIKYLLVYLIQMKLGIFNNSNNTKKACLYINPKPRQNLEVFSLTHSRCSLSLIRLSQFKSLHHQNVPKHSFEDPACWMKKKALHCPPN